VTNGEVFLKKLTKHWLWVLEKNGIMEAMSLPPEKVNKENMSSSDAISEYPAGISNRFFSNNHT